MFPVLCVTYVRLARREEREVGAEFGEVWASYARRYGMSKTLGPTYYEHDVEHPFLGQRIATDRGRQ
jgi:hypothetical protein